jgi:bacteriocin biosynthesis cyclodehydratase domain-containing protein
MKVGVMQDIIAETRPRLRRDVLFTQMPSGVLFHNAHGGFSLKTQSAYRFASLVVPHLNGENTVSALCQGLGDIHRDMLVKLVGALYEHGFARDATVTGGVSAAALTPEVSARFAPQMAYVDHYADDQAGRFQRFRQTRVAVLGDDLLARWCALSLVRNGCAAVGVLPGIGGAASGLNAVEDEARALTAVGCPVSITQLDDKRSSATGLLSWEELEEYDLVAVTGSPDGPAQLARLLQAGIPQGRRLLPAWTFGSCAVVGPLAAQGTTGCWVCAVLRLGANRDAGSAADVWSSIAPVAPREPAQPRLSRPLAAMLGNLLGYEIFRITTGAPPAETASQLIIQDLESLDAVAEPLLAHPRCPYCSPAGSAAGSTVVDLTAVDETATAGPLLADDAANEAATQAARTELETSAVLVGANSGVFGGFADESWNQIPLKVSTVTLGIGHSVRRQISAFDLHQVAAARLRGLLRAAEVYAEHVVPVCGELHGTEFAAARSKWPLIGPDLLTTASGTGTPAERIPAWATATSLLSGETVLVPTAALRPFGVHNRERIFEATCAGTGAGRSAAEAADRGLRTALSYDTLRQAVRGAVSAARISEQSFDGDPELTFLARSAKNMGVRLELLQFGDAARQPVPVLLARFADPETGAWHWAVGSALRWQQAAVEAVRDLLGTLQLGRELGAASGVDTGDPFFGGLDAGTIAVVSETVADLGATLTWKAALDRLRVAGQDVLLARVGAADLQAGGISVARILLRAGMRHAR